MEFCKQFNAQTQSLESGMPIPVVITVYADRSFTFVTKTPPASYSLKKAAKIEAGAKTTGTQTVGQVNRKQLEEIAKIKMPDLNCASVEAAPFSALGAVPANGPEGPDRHAPGARGAEERGQEERGQEERGWRRGGNGIGFPRGSDGESGGAPTTKRLSNRGALAEGAGKLDADAIAEKFDSIGARFSNSALRDMSVVSLLTLTDKKLLATALDTFATVLQQPTFPADALERVRNQMLIGLQDEEQSPGAIAEKNFYRPSMASIPMPHPRMASVKPSRR